MTPEDWERACCTQVDAEIFFPAAASREHEDTAIAISICRGCPIRAACLEHHLRIEAGHPLGLRYGIVGGLTPAERASLDARMVA